MKRLLLYGILFVTIGLTPACVGKHKSLCMNIAEGGNAHVELGYFYDSANMTITGPIHFSTVPDDATTNPCLDIQAGGSVTATLNPKNPLGSFSPLGP